MGELNECNYCKLRKLKQRAEAMGKYTLIREAKGPMGGVNVYEVPDPTVKYSLWQGSEDHDRYFVAWFQSVTDHCVC